MPSLLDTLQQLSEHSTQIHNYSQCNRRQAGPYSTAYLHSLVTPDLIRDGTDPERRSFGFIGEGNDYAKKAEKREGPVTPLKEWNAARGRGGGEDIEIVLRTAARLVDDYESMPRAKKTISALAEQHERQSQKIAELERLVAELSNPTRSERSSSPAPERPSKPAMSIDEAIAAEEASLRAIEAFLKPHREIQPQPTIQRAVSPEKSPIKPLDESPIRPRPSVFAPTPGKTPIREYPHISNSLVNSPRTKINRFTPLKNINTPKRRERGSVFGMRAAPRSVGGRSLMGQLQAVSPVKQSAPVALEEEVLGERENDTIRVPISEEVIPVPQAPAEEEEGQEEEDDGPTPQPSPAKAPSPVEVEGPKTAHGIVVDDESVVAAINKITSTYPDLIGGTSNTEDAINHLYTLSASDPEYIPSDQSSIASTTSTPSIPITKEMIAHSIICLLVLRSQGLLVPMTELKEMFAGVMRDRGEGWQDVDGFKMAFKIVSKKTMRFDRSVKEWGAQGALTFAV